MHIVLTDCKKLICINNTTGMNRLKVTCYRMLNFKDVLVCRYPSRCDLELHNTTLCQAEYIVLFIHDVLMF
jgi:hypothetical protein